jgi:CubicO group peptidase (beta-lactamase class C family)
VDAGLDADNPPAIGPAGTLHSSVIDLAIYAAFHLRGEKGDTTLLPHSAFVKLHTAYPNNDDYAHGWWVWPRWWANGNTLTHTGTNGQWFANMWLAPERDFAVIVVCNLGGTTAFDATDDACFAMIQDFLLK